MPRDPFEVKLSEPKREALVHWLIQGLEAAEAERQQTVVDREYWWALYEQARTRNEQTLPWPDAADLTSYLGAEKVDALHARLMRTIFTEPIWTVEGFGEAQARAALVEEFHQWRAEEERLQMLLGRVFLAALVDPVAVIEVTEGTARRKVRRTIRGVPETNPETGALVLGEDLKPILMQNPDGTYVQAAEDGGPVATAVVDEWARVRTGPVQRLIPYPDFLMLPAHATEVEDVWGYGKRVWRRLAEVQARAKDGFYRHVEALGEEDERDTTAAAERAQTAVAPSTGPAVEKELWEITFLYDFDGQGERWYLATLHRAKRVLLRLQHDELGGQRFVRVVLYPRIDSLEGYSFIGHKLVTLIEEHTAWRNMIADRAATATQAPMKRHLNALWDPEEEPIGPRSVITVRDMREVEPMQLPDVPAGALERERALLAAAERVAGISDMALGSSPATGRTLGERQMVAGYSEVRMEAVVKNAQEAMEDLAQIRHQIWKRALYDMEQRGETLSFSGEQLVGLESRGFDQAGLGPEGHIAPALLEGQFRFKPRGSVETADLGRLRQDFVDWLQTLPGLVTVFPALAQSLATPDAARAMWDQALRVFRVPNRQAFLGSQSQGLPPVPPQVPWPASEVNPAAPTRAGGPAASPAGVSPPGSPLAALFQNVGGPSG